MQKVMLSLLFILIIGITWGATFQEYGIDQNVNVVGQSKVIEIIFSDMESPVYIEPNIAYTGQCELGVYVNERFVDNIILDHNGMYYIKIPEGILLQKNKVQLIARADKGNMTIYSDSKITHENPSKLNITYSISPKKPSVGDIIVYTITIQNPTDLPEDISFYPRLRTDIFEVISGKEEYTLRIQPKEEKKIIILLKAKKSTTITMPAPNITCAKMPCEIATNTLPRFSIAKVAPNIDINVYTQRTYDAIDVRVVIKNNGPVDANISTIKAIINKNTTITIDQNKNIPVGQKITLVKKITRPSQETTLIQIIVNTQSRQSTAEVLVKPATDLQTNILLGVAIAIIGISVVGIVIYKTKERV